MSSSTPLPMPVPATTRTRGIALIVLGGALALGTAWLVLTAGVSPMLKVVLGSVVLVGGAFVHAGFGLLRRGTISGFQKTSILMAIALVFLLAGVLRDQLAGPAR